MRALDGDLAQFLIDVFAVCELLLDDVGLSDVLSGGSAIRRSCRQTTQRTISARPCSITSAPAIGMTVLK